MSSNSATPAAPRGRGRPRDTELRRRILTAAARLAADEGIDVSFERIANAAGASRTTLYRWWSGPGELLLDALLDSAAFSLETDETASIPDRLRAQVESAAAVLIDPATGGPLRALAATALSREERRIDFMDHWLAPRRDAARALILQGIAEGAIVDDDADLLLDVLFAPLYYRVFFTHQPLTAEYVDALVGRVLTA